MKYSMVKQFYNGALDNIYNFIFKWVDFGKTLIESFWAFVEIWEAFFLVFYNLFMYIYYFFLYLIDRGAETGQSSVLSRRNMPSMKSAAPSLNLSKGGANPIPAAYGMASSAATKASKAAENVSSTVKNATLKPASVKARRSPGRAILEFFAKLFEFIKNLFLKPIRAMGNFFGPKLKPVKEDTVPGTPGKRSLIDEYMKEYEESRRS